MKYLAMLILSIMMSGCITNETCREMAKEMSVSALGCSTFEGKEKIRVSHLRFIKDQLSGKIKTNKCDGCDSCNPERLKISSLQEELEKCNADLSEAHRLSSDQTECSCDKNKDGWKR